MKIQPKFLVAAAFATLAITAGAQVYGPNTQTINGRPVNLTNYTTDSLGRVISNPSANNSGAENWQSVPVGLLENVAQPTPEQFQFVQPEAARTIGSQTAAQQRDSVQDILAANNARVTFSTETQTLGCPAGYSGSIVQTRQVATTGAGAVTYGAWSQVSNTCVVIPPVITTGLESRSAACPVGQVGSITETRTVTYEDGVAKSATAWSQTSNTCATPTAAAVTTYGSENRSYACGAGQTGDIFETRQVTYVNGVITAYGAWVGAGNTCAAIPVPVVPSCSPTPFSQCEGINFVTRDSCTSAILNVDWNSISCGTPVTYSTETQSLPCPPGQSGAHDQSRQVTYTGGVPTAYGAWNTVSYTCVATAPTDPLVRVDVFACGVHYASAMVPQSQAASWLAANQAAANAALTDNGVCGVGL